MEFMILVCALIIEAGFAGYSIFTKSNQVKLKNYLRIGAFAAFVILALVSIIQWGSRWLGLAVLLLIWAVFGVWGLVRHPSREKSFKTASVLSRAIGTLLLVGVVMLPALVFPQHKLPRVTGSHPVTTVSYTYIDKNRIETFTSTGENRAVNVEFWYPQDANQRYPLVVFSHGAFGMKGSNTSTFIELASHGYVVCSIDHPYHALYTRSVDGKVVTVDPTFFQEVRDTNSGKYSEAESFKLEKNWMALREADINFVLDTIIAQAYTGNAGTVYQFVDPRKIGLIGHSLGGESSAQVARQRSDISAVINLDADLGGEYRSYSDGKYVMNDTVYPVPLLTIYSDVLARLIDAIPDANIVVAVKHVSATSPQAFEVQLTGTDHMSLTDLPIISPVMVSLINSSVPKGGGQEVAPLAAIEKMNGIVLNFFDVYLKGEGSFTTRGVR